MENAGLKVTEPNVTTGRDLTGVFSMKAADVKNLSSMPLSSPSYPRGPYRFIDREYLIVTYESDPDAIREALPEPLEPDGSNYVFYEFIACRTQLVLAITPSPARSFLLY